MDPPVHTNHCKHIFHWVTPKNMILGLMNENPWELMVVTHRRDGGNDRIPRTDFVLSQGDFQHLIHGNSGKITQQHTERENSSLCINMGETGTDLSNQEGAYTTRVQWHQTPENTKRTQTKSTKRRSEH